MSKIGFTGTRRGMSEHQARVLRQLLTELMPDEFHHGDCIGADAEAFVIATMLGIKTISHPPLNSRFRAFTKSTETHEPQDYIERNHAIVDATDRLVIAPKSRHEERRSGTWATFRYAMSRGKAIDFLSR